MYHAVLSFGPFFPDFGPDLDFFEEMGPEMFRIYTKKSGFDIKMEERTMKIGLFEHAFNDALDVIVLEKSRICFTSW